MQKQRHKFDCTGKAWILSAISTLHCVTGFKPHKKVFRYEKGKSVIFSRTNFDGPLKDGLGLYVFEFKSPDLISRKIQVLMAVKRFLFGLWINLKYVEKHWIFSTYLNLFGKELLLYHRPCFHPGHKFWKISNKSSPKLFLPV